MPKTKDTGRLLRGIWIDSNKAPVEDSGGWTSDARRIRLPRRLFLSLDCCCCCCRCHDDGATGRAKRLWHPDLCIDSGRMTLNNKKRKKRRRKITQSEASAVTLPHGAEFFRCSHLNTKSHHGDFVLRSTPAPHQWMKTCIRRKLQFGGTSASKKNRHAAKRTKQGANLSRWRHSDRYLRRRWGARKTLSINDAQINKR